LTALCAQAGEQQRRLHLGQGPVRQQSQGLQALGQGGYMQGLAAGAVQHLATHLGLVQQAGAHALGTELDLIVSCLLLLGFVAQDAGASGRSFWPWAVATLALGSLGVLGYLLWPTRRRLSVHAQPQ